MTNTIIRRKLRVLAGCLLIILVGILAGCESLPVDAGTMEDPDTTARTRVFQTDDGRRVTCLVLGSNDALGQSGGTVHPSGLSCDWIHADGSDYRGDDR